MRKDRGLETKVGLFVLVGVSVLVGLIFMLGAERHIFDSRAHLFVRFGDIEGLKVGAPVRLAGLDVGVVRDISFSTDPADRRLVISLDVRAAVLERIRADSTASIGSRGLLGDKTVDIEVGSPEALAVEPGAELIGENPADFFTLINKADEMLDNGVRITESARKIADSIASSEIQEDFGRLVTTLADLAVDVKKGKGFLHSLVYDDTYQKQVFAALEDIVASTAEVRSAAGDVNRIIDGIQEGPGALHSLIYDPKGATLVEELGRAATQIEEITRSMRDEKGIVHQLIFEQKDKDPVGDLARTAADLRIVVERLKKGEGTIGALLRDPTVYEDLKLTLGEVRRNKLLKAVLRMAIEERDEKPPSLNPRP